MNPITGLVERRDRRRREDERLVLNALHPYVWKYGIEVQRATGVPRRRLYAALSRLVGARLAATKWSANDPEPYEPVRRMWARVER